MAVPSSGSGAVVVRCRDRAGSRESMVAGACGGCNGCGRMGRRKAAYPCTQSVPRQDGLPYRDRTAADGLSEIAPLCEDGRSKKACAPFWDTGRKSRLVKRLRGKSSRIDSRDATEWRPQAVPVATQEATGIDSRDATGWRPQAVPVSEKDAARDHRQRGGALKLSAVGDTGPTDIAGRMRDSLSSSKAGCPGRYALRGRPARWAKPMRAWVSLAAVKSA